MDTLYCVLIDNPEECNVLSSLIYTCLLAAGSILLEGILDITNELPTILLIATVAGRNPDNQLSLVVSTVIHKVSYIPSGAEYLPSTILKVHVVPAQVGRVFPAMLEKAINVISQLVFSGTFVW